MFPNVEDRNVSDFTLPSEINPKNLGKLTELGDYFEESHTIE